MHAATRRPERCKRLPRGRRLGNSAPLPLFAFAVTRFMLSMVNADAINRGVEPVVFGVALMFGGDLLVRADRRMILAATSAVRSTAIRSRAGQAGAG
jgi:succinate-acetate transporter protein